MVLSASFRPLYFLTESKVALMKVDSLDDDDKKLDVLLLWPSLFDDLLDGGRGCYQHCTQGYNQG